MDAKERGSHKAELKNAAKTAAGTEEKATNKVVNKVNAQKPDLKKTRPN